MAKKKSDLSRAFSEDGELKTHIGGQALLEGIMMRGRYNWAVAVREPDGKIYTEEHDLASGKQKNRWMYWPIVRGCTSMVESLMLGYQALEVSAMHAYDEQGESFGTLQEKAAKEAEAGEGGDEAASEGEGEATDAEAAAAGEAAPAAEPEAANAPEAAAVPGEPAAPAEPEEPAEFAGRSDFEAPAASDGEEHEFSWKDDFGRPDTMIDALGAQRTLDVVSEPAPEAATAAAAPSAADEKAAKEGEEEKTSFWDEEVELTEKDMVISMVLGVVLGLVLFMVAPAVITNLIVGEYDDNSLLWNIVDGLLRVGVFILYIWLIGRMSDIKRMFSYHGAEHKTIHCYEHGMELTPENARSFPRLHVRCGTAFLIMVMIIAILVYTITPLDGLIAAWGVPDGAPKLILVLVVRILLLPIIAGISYEITVKWAGTHPENPAVKVVLWPGLQMQYLTTNEPDDGMLECAIAAMNLVLEREEAEAAKAAGREPAAAGEGEPQDAGAEGDDDAAAAGPAAPEVPAAAAAAAASAPVEA